MRILGFCDFPTRHSDQLKSISVSGDGSCHIVTEKHPKDKTCKHARNRIMTKRKTLIDAALNFSK